MDLPPKLTNVSGPPVNVAGTNVAGQSNAAQPDQDSSSSAPIVNVPSGLQYVMQTAGQNAPAQGAASMATGAQPGPNLALPPDSIFRFMPPNVQEALLRGGPISVEFGVDTATVLGEPETDPAPPTPPMPAFSEVCLSFEGNMFNVMQFYAERAQYLPPLDGPIDNDAPPINAQQYICSETERLKAELEKLTNNKSVIDLLTNAYYVTLSNLDRQYGGVVKPGLSIHDTSMWYHSRIPVDARISLKNDVLAGVALILGGNMQGLEANQ